MLRAARFILLKGGRIRSKTGKQAEIRVAILPKILRISGKFGSQDQKKTRDGCIWANFRPICLICSNCALCYSVHKTSSAIGAVFRNEMQAKDQLCIGFDIYTYLYMSLH
jgi:hypothetical protein